MPSTVHIQIFSLILQQQVGILTPRPTLLLCWQQYMELEECQCVGHLSTEAQNMMVSCWSIWTGLRAILSWAGSTDHNKEEFHWLAHLVLLYSCMLQECTNCYRLYSSYTECIQLTTQEFLTGRGPSSWSERDCLFPEAGEATKDTGRACLRGGSWEGMCVHACSGRGEELASRPWLWLTATHTSCIRWHTRYWYYSELVVVNISSMDTTWTVCTHSIVNC